MKKIFFFCLALIAIFFFLGKELSPLDSRFFLVHDNTQGARIQEFALNLQKGIIPPRLAPDFSFQHGFPVFNFYAPVSYWIGAFFKLIGLSTVISLKLVFLLGLIGAFISFFLFSSLFFGFWGALLGATVYSSSLWMAVEIFVRGNMGEIWFLTLLPLGLYFLKRSDAEDKSWLFFTSTVVLSFVFSVHNVLSLVSVFFVGLFLFGLTHKKKALASYVSGLLLASYFLLPAVLESGLTYANEIATKTKFTDHFLCVWQLWKANKWSYGGSGIGCLNDDMSFQIGKLHILLALVGVGIFMSLFIKVKKRKSEYIPLFILVWTIFCTFLTLSISQPFWDVFSPIMASFQYPWRFLSFVLFGCAYFASYIPRVLKNKKIAVILSVALSLILLYSSTKFFSKPWKYSSDEYTSMLLTQKYIQQRAAYEIPEYFPRSGNYPMWRTYDTSEKGFSTISLLHKVNTPFYKEFITTAPISILPIHYFPFWDIRIDNIQVIPEKFDSLGRPILSGYLAHSTISVRYNETPIEKIGNGITLVIFIVLVLFCSSKKIWKKMNTILH